MCYSHIVIIKELTRLRAEAKFMEEQLQRTSKELRVYQLKYPQAASRIGRAEVRAVCLHQRTHD